MDISPTPEAFIELSAVTQLSREELTLLFEDITLEMLQGASDGAIRRRLKRRGLALAIMALGGWWIFKGIAHELW